MNTKWAPRGPNRMGLSDEELVERVRRRGVAGRLAFEALADRYSAAITRRCRYRLGNVHDAEDVTQEVLVRIYRGLGNYRGQASFRTWLFAIVENECTT